MNALERQANSIAALGQAVSAVQAKVQGLSTANDAAINSNSDVIDAATATLNQIAQS